MVEFISLFSNVFLLGATFIVCLFLLDFMKKRKNGSHFPPGPRGLPFLGNILQVENRNPTVTYNQLRKQYGDIFSLQYFWSKTVVLNGFEVNKEALINRSEEIADRPPLPIFEKLLDGKDKKGILLAHYGSSWKEQRRFTLTTLRNFGMGKKSLEERVTEEAKFLCSEFLSQKDIIWYVTSYGGRMNLWGIGVHPNGYTSRLKRIGLKHAQDLIHIVFIYWGFWNGRG